MNMNVRFAHGNQNETVVHAGQDIMNRLRTLAAANGVAGLYVISGSGTLRNVTLRKRNAAVSHEYTEENGTLKIRVLHGQFIRGDEDGSKLKLGLGSLSPTNHEIEVGYVEGDMIAASDVKISYALKFVDP